MKRIELYCASNLRWTLLFRVMTQVFTIERHSHSRLNGYSRLGSFSLVKKPIHPRRTGRLLCFRITYKFPSWHTQNSAITHPEFNDMAHLVPEGSPFQITNIQQGRGHSLTATRDIKRGENIIDEAPLAFVRWASGYAEGPYGTIPDTAITESSVQNAVHTLSPTNHENFLSLPTKSRSPEDQTNRAQFTHNAFTASAQDGTTFSGIFLTASLMNHSCYPNVCFHWSGVSLPDSSGVVRAVSHIRAGEEITLSYIRDEHCLPTAQRRQLLRQRYGFECACRLCATIHMNSTADPRREQLGRYHTELQDWAAGTTVTTANWIRSTAVQYCKLFEKELGGVPDAKDSAAIPTTVRPGLADA